MISLNTVRSIRVKRSLTIGVEQSEVDLFRDILLSSFPRGISFSPTSESLLASTAGKAMPTEVRCALQAQMFKREDDAWLFPEMVADDAVVARLVSRAETYLQEFWCFSLDVLRDEFLPSLRNLPNAGGDFYQFFLRGVAPKLSCRVNVSGSKTIQLCHKSGQKEVQVYETVATQISQVLQERCDAVSVESLHDQLPFIDIATINALIQKKLPSTIGLTLDGVDYWKLLDFFYLPEDMNEQVTRIVDQLEAEGTSPSATLIKSRLNQVYGWNFCENFAVPDLAVFQQIISASYQGKESHVWKNHVFRRESDEFRNNVLDDFLKTQTGIFNELEFFDYALQTRGMTNHGMLILTFLRTRCIRLNRDQWISTDLFGGGATLSLKETEFMVKCLEQKLGNQAFLPLGTLPAKFL